jgi:glycosyltransferase involved in cell wall biosynthesis
MVEAAVNDGLEVAVSVSNRASIPSKFPSLQHNGISIFRRRPSFRLARIEALLAKVASPFLEAFRWKPDVICISQGWAYESLACSDLLDLLYTAGVPYVVVCQYNDDKVLGRDIRESATEFFQRAFRVVFVARENMKSVERHLARRLPNAIVLQNPVNLSDLAALPWPTSPKVNFATVASLRTAHKGQDILFEILGSPVWPDRDWRLGLYGEGQDREYLEALARHFAIADHIEFCGHVKDIKSVWKSNHVLVLPSRGEGTPLALVEAMLCGRPAVVTDVGGNTEWIEDGRTGFVAEAPTAKSLGLALERAWLAQGDWEKMGNQARENALSRFDKSAGKSLLKILFEAKRSSQTTSTGSERSVGRD